MTLFGYGTNNCVDRGHLTIKDGIGKRTTLCSLSSCWPWTETAGRNRIGWLVSLAALRWLADQGAAFVMLDRLGEVLATTGPVHPSDARLRRAQALANRNWNGISNSQFDLISQKARWSGKRSLREIAQLRSYPDNCCVSRRTQVSSEFGGCAIKSRLARRSHIGRPGQISRFSTRERDLRRVPDHWQSLRCPCFSTDWVSSSRSESAKCHS